MAVYEVYSQAERRRYKTTTCSKATFVQLFCVLLTFIPPLLIAYRSEGFWLRIDNYVERPNVKFKHEILSILQLKDGSYVAWSTFANFNRLQAGKIRIPVIKSREEDLNRDGKNDQLQLTLEMPMMDTEEVVSAQLLLTFDFALNKFSTFRMQSLAYLVYNSAVPGAVFRTIGDLRLSQKEPLGHRGIDTRFNTPVIDSTKIDAEYYMLANIFEEYSKRNVTTKYEDSYPVWIMNRAAGQPFTIKTTIRYPEETILYRPGFWQLIKWAWVQYIAILVVFIFIFHRIKDFIFQNQLVSTIIERPFKQRSS